MIIRRFATPLDARTVVIREWKSAMDGPDIDSQLTPLRVLWPTDSNHVDATERVQIVATLPAGQPALSREERRTLGDYFEWDDAPSFWWQTLNPAYFDVERLDNDVFLATLVERGRIIPVAGSPARRPDASEVRFVLGAYPDRRETYTTIGNGSAPSLRSPDEDNEPVYQSRRTMAQLATFPTRGPELVALRTMRRPRESAREVAALEKEGEILEQLWNARPTSVSEILHRGQFTMDDAKGPYLALRPPVGVHMSTMLGAWVHSAKKNPELVCRHLLLDMAYGLVALQGFGWYAGMLTPGLFRVRPAATNVGGRRAFAVLIALPAAVSASSTTILADRLPLEDGDYVAAHPGRVLERSTRQDLISLGAIGGHMLNLARVDRTSGLRTLCGSLSDGEFVDCDEVIGLIKSEAALK